MSEPPPPAVPENAPFDPAQALSPEAVRTVLADFQSWLEALSGAADNGRPEPPAAEVDLHTLVEQMTALRHEVNLQTRALRAHQEQGAEALRQLGDALDSVRQTQARQQSPEEHQRPLLKTLVDLYDSLALAGREMDRQQQTLAVALADLTDLASADEPAPQEPAPKLGSPRSLWERWFGPPALPPEERARQEEEERARQAQWQRREQLRQGSTRAGQMLGSLVTGYSMSLQRIERALQQHGLEPIAAVGAPFDPERMEAVEVVADSGRPGGEVIEEVRRGYLWKGRVFRYAQVRVARA
jgi:molecular chaperone GrpE